jgi:hypothetical protein
LQCLRVPFSNGFETVVLTLFCVFTRPCVEAAEVSEEEKAEEEEMDLGGGVDMFRGEEAGGGDYQAKQTPKCGIEGGIAPQVGDARSGTRHCATSRR